MLELICLRLRQSIMTQRVILVLYFVEETKNVWQLLSLLFSLEAVFVLRYCLSYKSANLEEKAD